MVKHFEKFYVENGNLYGDEDGIQYLIEQILYKEGKKTEVTYWDGDDQVTIVQSESGKYYNPNTDPVKERYAAP